MQGTETWFANATVVVGLSGYLNPDTIWRTTIWTSLADAGTDTDSCGNIFYPYQHPHPQPETKTEIELRVAYKWDMNDEGSHTA